MKTSNLKQQYEEVVRNYLHETAFEPVPLAYDSSMENHAVTYLQSRGFSPDAIRQAMPKIEAAVWIAATTYPFVPTNVRNLIGVYTALAILIDDASGEMLSDLRDFQARILRNEPQSNQLLASLADTLNTLRGVYCPFIGDMILKSTLDFLSACRFEEEHKETNPRMIGAEFPYYMRLKSGVAEPYACFAFPEALYPESDFLRTYLPVIPDLARFFNFGNDLLSFYKESIVSTETLNYINNHAKVNNCTPIESLNETRASLVVSIRRIREILAVDPQTQDNINRLINGYVVYHFSSRRYKLSELDIVRLEPRVATPKVAYRENTFTSTSEIVGDGVLA